MQQVVDEQTLPKLKTLAAQLADPVAGLQPSLLQYWGRQQPSFTGAQLTNWLATSGGTETTPDQTAGLLLEHQLISPATPTSPFPPVPLTQPVTSTSSINVEGFTQVQPQENYLLVSQAAAPIRGQPLNTSYWWTKPARPATQVAESLRRLILQLYGTHLSEDGRSVNYTAMRDDPQLAEYIRATAELQRVDLRPLGREELCALFINLYNTLIVHATVVLGPAASVLERSRFFQTDAAYLIGGHIYSADAMENGVLRGNRPPASRILVLMGLGRWAAPTFEPQDPRAAKVVSPMDPRIHFTLVCGARSCPPISVYTPTNLDRGMQVAGIVFCGSEVEVDVSKRTVRLSMIFKWYSVDFGSDERERLQYILQFLQEPSSAQLRSLLEDGGKVKVEYKPYDWTLNT